MEKRPPSKGPIGPPLGELASKIGLTAEQYAELVGLFIDTSRKDLVRVSQALKAGNTTAGIEAAHSLKGAAIGLGLAAIHQRAQLLENSIRSGCLDQARDQLNHLNADLDGLSEFSNSNSSASSV